MDPVEAGALPGLTVWLGFHPALLPHPFLVASGSTSLLHPFPHIPDSRTAAETPTQHGQAAGLSLGQRSPNGCLPFIDSPGDQCLSIRAHQSTCH